jgi:ribonuclease HI
MGEAFAALQTLEFSRDLDLHYILLEGDSLQVVNMILEQGENWCRYGPVVADIHLILGSFRRWEIVHAKRTQNHAAHGLAKEATREVMDKVWIEEIPLCIYDIILSEQFALFV